MFKYNVYMDDPTIPGTQQLVKNELSDAIAMVPQPSDDPNDPLNWSAKWKLLHVLLISSNVAIIFGSQLWTSTVYNVLSTDFGVSFGQLNLGIGLSCVCMAIGDLLVQVTSVAIGRRFTYLVLTFLNLIGAIIFSACPTYTGYMLFYIFSGFAVAPTSSLVLVTISDVFFLHDHGKYVGIVTIALSVGQVFGPVLSGYIQSGIGWHWANYIVVILCGAQLVAQYLFLEESLFERQQVPLLDDSDSLEKAGGSVSFASDSQRKSLLKRLQLVASHASGRKTNLAVLIVRPFLALRYPAVLWLAIATGCMMFWMDWWSVTMAEIYGVKPYNFSSNAIGNLTYAGAVGIVLSFAYLSVSDRYLVWKLKRNNGLFEPEHRLDLFWLPTLLNTMGLGMYGLAPTYSSPWIVGAIGIALLNFGQMVILSILQTYILECFPLEAIDTMVIVCFVKYVFGAVMSFVCSPWMAEMGLQDMTWLIVAISLVVNLFGLVFVFWGKNIRKWSHEWLLAAWMS